MTNFESTIICRCEEVSFQTLQETANAHHCSARELKLRTRAGMGFCGGRTCRPILDRVIAEVIPTISVAEIPLKYQPPVRAVSFGTVGERADG